MATSDIDKKALAAHVIRALGRAHAQNRAVTLAELARSVRVRQPDVRGIVTSLDREGFVDARRMRLTLAGLALAASLAGLRLPALRATQAASVAAA